MGEFYEFPPNTITLHFNTSLESSPWYLLDRSSPLLSKTLDPVENSYR